MKIVFFVLFIQAVLYGQVFESARTFAPHVIGADHSVPAISADGSEIYWAQRSGDVKHRRIFRVLVDKGKWGEAQVMSFTDADDGDCPVLAPDGQTLYFNSFRATAEAGRRERIWYVTRVGEGWSEALPPPGDINHIIICSCNLLTVKCVP